MSNTSFLSDSFLFTDDKTSLYDRSTEEIEKELDKYRDYLNQNMDKLKQECISQEDQTTIISDFRPINYLPEEKLITQSALYVHKYVIDAPLFYACMTGREVHTEQADV